MQYEANINALYMYIFHYYSSNILVKNIEKGFKGPVQKLRLAMYY